MTINTSELSDDQVGLTVSNMEIIHKIQGLVEEHGLSDSIRNLITNEDSLNHIIDLESIETCVESLTNISRQLTNCDLEHSIVDNGIGVMSNVNLKSNCPIAYLSKSTNDRLAMSLIHDKEANTNIKKHNNDYLLHTTKDIEKHNNLSIDYDNLDKDVLSDIYNIGTESVKEVTKKYVLQPGDIVLFSEFTTIDSIQNVFTALGTFSKFTHVGIVVEKENKIYLLDATSHKGIALTSPNRYGLNNVYICIRRCSRPKLFVYEKSRTCKKFLDEVVGKEFAAASKFLRAVFGAMPVLGNNKAKKERLFCSEVVALLLKRLGLLNVKSITKNSATFTPKDFYNMRISGYDKPLAVKGRNIFTSDYNKVYK